MPGRGFVFLTIGRSHVGIITLWGIYFALYNGIVAVLQGWEVQKMGSAKQNVIEQGTSTEAILESISDGVFTVDKDWKIMSFNRAAEEITGIMRRDAIGRLCSEVFRSNMCETDCALRKTLLDGNPIIGKTGYVVDANGKRIPISLSTAVLKDQRGLVIGGAETFRDMSEVESLRQELQSRYSVGSIVSRSQSMRRLLEVVPAVASSPSTVLITGETGTGKELMARTIHALSKRAHGPFLAINCGALPDSLLESELFGYKAGAFTGAHKDKPGKFGLAKGGTIFLDEIGEISPALQIRLLRVIQERVYEPLGGTRSLDADVRILVATNRDLSEMVKEGSFREDLYYRINVIQIKLPPLRERKEDLPLLVGQFIGKFNSLHGRSIAGVAPEVHSLFMAYHWPGNVRELENVIERAFVMCSGQIIDIAHLPEDVFSDHGYREGKDPLHRMHDELEMQIIRDTLVRCNFNRERTARELNMHKTTLFRKIARLGMVLPDKDGRSSRHKQ